MNQRVRARSQRTSNNVGLMGQERTKRPNSRSSVPTTRFRRFLNTVWAIQLTYDFMLRYPKYGGYSTPARNSATRQLGEFLTTSGEIRLGKDLPGLTARFMNRPRQESPNPLWRQLCVEKITQNMDCNCHCQRSCTHENPSPSDTVDKIHWPQNRRAVASHNQ